VNSEHNHYLARHSTLFTRGIILRNVYEFIGGSAYNAAEPKQQPAQERYPNNRYAERQQN
jgi:hypothetical protein